MTPTAKISEFFRSVTFTDLPTESVVIAKTLIIDTLGVSILARREPLLSAAAEMASDLGGNGQATVWGSQMRAPMPEAAFVNGVAAAVLDYDSVHLDGNVHSVAVTLPAALSVAEGICASGREFLTAFILGTELVCRLGLSAVERRGWFHTSLFGVFGAAAASAKLLGQQGAAHALGHALGRASGTQQPVVERSASKFILSANAARDGVLSAMLASNGIAAPASVFEGKYGLGAMYTSVDEDTLLDRLGHEFRFDGTSLKQYPCCAVSQSAIEAALQLRAAGPQAVQNASAMRVIVSPFAARLAGTQYDPAVDPRVAAQFSVQYAIACALQRGRFTLADINAEAAQDPRIVALARSIEVVVDDDSPTPMVSTLVVLNADGTSVKIRGRDPFVSPSGTKGREVAESKLHAAGAGMGVTDDTVEALIACVDGLEGADNVSELADKIAALQPRTAFNPTLTSQNVSA